MKRFLKILRIVIPFTNIIMFAAIVYCLVICIDYHCNHYGDNKIPHRAIDDLGLLVTFLTMLVTVLVTWQIYQTINAKEESKKIKQLFNAEFNRVNKAIKAQKETTLLSEQALYLLYEREITGKHNNEIGYEFLHSSILTVVHASQMRKFDLCNSIVNNLLRIMSSRWNFWMFKSKKEELRDLLLSANEIKNITNLSALLEKIENITEPIPTDKSSRPKRGLDEDAEYEEIEPTK
ncbi:hypothetical protein [uncultured Muribaculum sp.]|uniref:hypothetical protein n=1 Tax=uncultured Muribaculum sp. TaxID=1918613 RepID=UPI0025AF8AB4|nr:hypothetical protein [uncultured Muribaculum sp.]